MNENNIDIFICSHKDFVPLVSNKDVYRILSPNRLNNETSYNLDVIYEQGDKWLQYNSILNDFTLMVYIYENHIDKVKDYIGFVHYRRNFVFYDNVPNIDELFHSNDVICGNSLIPFDYGLTIATYYANCHNIDDLNRCDGIIKELYKDDETIYNKWIEYKNTNAYHNFHACNMFIMKKENFIEYMKFIIPIVKAYMHKVNVFSHGDAVKHCEQEREKYNKGIPPYMQYQSRFIGFVIERLTSFFIYYRFTKPLVISIDEKK